MMDCYICRRLDFHPIPMNIYYYVALFAERQSISGSHNLLHCVKVIALWLMKADVDIELFTSFGVASSNMIDIILGIRNYYSIEWPNYLEQVSVELIETSPFDLVLTNESSQEEMTEGSNSSNWKLEITFIGVNCSISRNVPFAVMVPHLDERAIYFLLNSSCAPINLRAVLFSVISKLIERSANYFKSRHEDNDSTAFTNYGKIEVRGYLIVLEKNILALNAFSFLNNNIIRLLLKKL